MGTLGSFIRFLGDHGLLGTEKVTAEGLDFDTRLRIQKYTYLAGRLGLEHEYSYSLYRYGPYSPSLANAYYALAEDPARLAAESGQQLAGGLEQERFLQLVRGRDASWLEVASTLVDQNPRFQNDEDLVRHVERIKCNYSEGYIRDVLSDLKTHGMIVS